MKMLIATIALAALACGSDSSGPTSITLNLTSVDSRPVPTAIQSGNGTTTIVSGTVRGTPNVSTCEFSITASGGVSVNGGAFDCPVQNGVAVALTLSFPGPVFGPGTHVYRFGP